MISIITKFGELLNIILNFHKNYEWFEKLDQTHKRVFQTFPNILHPSTPKHLTKSYHGGSILHGGSATALEQSSHKH